MPPQSPAGAATHLPSRGDNTVAPYLTHIITHHGQVTLVPPQNQGRVRKDKRTRKLNVVQNEQTDAEGSSTPSILASSLGSTTPRSKKRRKHKPNAGPTVSNVADQGPSRALAEPQTTFSPLSPPPSYHSLHHEVPASVGNGAMPLSSSASSDDFEDISEVDLNSQWVLDRMAGFTLEERVSREWHRQQAAAEQESSHSIDLCRTPSRSEGTLPVSSTQPPPFPNDSSGAPDTNHSSTVFPALPASNPPESISSTSGGSRICSPRVSSKDISQQALGIEMSLCESSLEDLDIVESVPTDASRSHLVSVSENPKAPTVRKNSSERGELPIAPPQILESRTSEPGSTVVAEHRGNPPENSTEQFTTISSPHPDFPTVELRETISPSPRTSRKGKERETESVRDNGPNLSIHNRPLPALPGSLEPLRPANLFVNEAPSSSAEAISPSLVQPGLKARKIPDPLLPARPSDSAPTGGPPQKATLSPISVRDRIMRFESMSSRPVPPPPLDFLSKTRAKRKPPPPPDHLGVSGQRREDAAFIDQSLDVMMGNESGDRVEVQSPSHSPFGHHNSELLPPSIPEIRDIRPSPPPPPLFSPIGTASITGNSVARSASSSEADNQSSICASVASHDLNTTIETGSNTENPEQSGLETPAGPVSQEPAIPEPAPVPGTSHAAPLDSSIAGNSTADLRPSAPSTSNTQGAEAGLGPYTDLDVLLSRLDDASSGNRYEDLLIVSELLGPAQPQSTPPHVVGDIPLGRIEVVRRRKLQDGRIKLKLSLLGVMVDRCSVCLSQFKDAEWAVLLPCVHAFHSTCIQSWLARSHTCPLCRVTLDI